MTPARTRASQSAEHATRRALRCVSACALFVFPARAAADPCAPRAALAGDAAAVARVAAELQRLGVATDGTLPEDRPGSGCPQVVAQVELDTGGGIAVAVRDRTHRSEGRVVSDPALAAVWIDSWLRDDFEAPLATAPDDVAAPSVQAEAQSRPARPWFDRFALSAGIDQAWTGDATRWKGLAGAACGRVERLGGTCVGARVRYATQDVVAGMTAAHRTDTSVLATAAMTFALGSMHVSPELGVGVGRMTTARVEGCKPVDPMPPPNCDPNDPMCVMPPLPCDDPSTSTVYVGDQFFTATWTPRLSATLHVAVPLFDHVWLEGVALAGVAPLGHRDPYVYQPQPNAMLPGMELSLPGEPLGSFVVGIGLRVGAP